MKNETKRSVTAVLLAAAMLLSTQGVTAFADTDKNEPVIGASRAMMAMSVKSETVVMNIRFMDGDTFVAGGDYTLPEGVQNYSILTQYVPEGYRMTVSGDFMVTAGGKLDVPVEKISTPVDPTDPTDPTDPGTNPGGNTGNNDDDDDRYTGGNTVTRTINDDDVPLNDRPTNTTTIDDEDVPLADLPDDTVTIDDGEVPLKANPSTGDSLPFAAMAAAALSLGGAIVLNRKKK